jgi:hypothetical protein
MWIVCDIALQHEAGVIARCLIGVDPTGAERMRYAEAVAAQAVPLTDRERRLWRRMLAQPLLFNAVDGALALVRPGSGIRQRSYTMLAVLETTPTYADLFLARARPRPRVALSVAITAAKGILRMLFGLVVVAATR